MIEEFESYLERFDEQTKNIFSELNELVLVSSRNTVDQKLWARLPSYYVGDNFVRIIPFSDHINIEAKTVILYRDKLREYKITPKGMLQIFHNQPIPVEVLKLIFLESFE